MNYLRVRNWEKYQHYKKESSPPWIKLHRTLLSDYEFNQLSELNRGRLIRLYLLAASTNNRIPNDARWVAKQIGASNIDLGMFTASGFLEPLYTSSREALESTEQSREEEKTKAENYVVDDILVRKLLNALPDKDEGTETVIRSIAKSRQLPEAAFGLAIDAAQGGGVLSPTKVAISVLKTYERKAA